MKPVSIKVGLRRLERLAKILDTADAEHRKRGEPKYDQSRVEHIECGSPGCAIGHWAAANPDRFGLRRIKSFDLSRSEYFVFVCKKDDNSDLDFDKHGQSEFGINENEASELFYVHGCGDARTAKQAAKYIRKFVARKRKELAGG
jgi:hypothetical protein